MEFLSFSQWIRTIQLLKSQNDKEQRKTRQIQKKFNSKSMKFLSLIKMNQNPDALKKNNSNRNLSFPANQTTNPETETRRTKWNELERSIEDGEIGSEWIKIMIKNEGQRSMEMMKVMDKNGSPPLKVSVKRTIITTRFSQSFLSLSLSLSWK